MNVENIILKSLLNNEQYARKVLPFIKQEYFAVEAEKNLFGVIKDFILKYNTPPTIDSLKVEIETSTFRDDIYRGMKTILSEFETPNSDAPPNEDWLISKTEKFCQEKAIYNAIMTSIEIMDDKTKNTTLSKGAIPQLLSDALAVSFDPNVGHSYTEDYEKRFEYYHRVQERLPFDLEYFNEITRGGLPRKTLNIAMAGTGVGKSLFMCHVAASHLNQGKNVLYITLELAEEEVAKRIDANLLNISFDDLMALNKTEYIKRIEKVKSKSNGKLIVKEYPTAGASTIHFKALLNELKLKKSFVPDIIFVDYLNICSSSRIKPGGNVNSYTYVKSIAEELRGLGVEHDVPIFSATQVNRTGFVSSDVGLEDTSESFGLPATADFMFAIISTEELQQLNQVMIKQLKNRYNDPTINKRFVVGIDRSKMKLHDCDASAQKNIADSGQTPASANTRTFATSNKFKKLKV